MADKDNKNNGIKIDISYKYDSSGLKRAVADIEKVDTQTERGISQTKKNIKALVAASQSMAQYLYKDNEKVAKALERQQKAYEAITKAQNAYKRTQSQIKVARQNLASVRNSVAFTKAGNARKNVRVDGTTVYRKTRKGEIVDEQATKRLVAASERLKMARLAQKDVTLSLQQAENSYKNSLLNTAQANDKAHLKQLNKELGLTAEQQELIAKSTKKLDLDKIPNKLKSISDRIKQIDLFRLVSQVYILSRVWKQILRFTEASSSWVENLNLLEVVFADTADEAKDFVKTAANNFGLDANALAQYVSTFKQMANAMGQASETGTQMAEALTYLALDISSLRNVDMKTAASDLASGIAGQVKPVRKYGFDITENSVNALLKEIGGGSSSSLTQANKQLARTILLIRQSKDAWGDMAKTINTFANQQRVMNDQWETTKRLVGTLLIGTFKLTDSFEEASKTAGIAQKAIWYINGALFALNDILGAIIPQAEELNGGIATGVDDAVDDYDKLTGAVNGSLASFDKFNTLSGGSGGLDLTGGLSEVFGKEYQEYIDKFKQNMGAINMYSRKIADNILKILYPKYGTWLQENENGTFAEWAKETKTLSGEIDSFKNGLFGVLELVLALKSPALALAGVVAKTIIEDTDAFYQFTDFLGKTVTALGKIVEFLSDTKLLIPAIVTYMSVMSGFKIANFVLEHEKLLGVFTKLGSVISNKLHPAMNSLLQTEITTGIPRIKQMASEINGTTVALSSCTLALGALLGMAVLDQFEGKTKKIVSAVFLAVGAFTALAAAVMAYQGALTVGIAVPIITAAVGVGIAGIKGLIDSAKEHADGGFQTGGLFYAGEKGAEWVGRQGSTSTIVNDTQMSDIMRESVAQGVKSGMASAYGDISRAGSGSGEAAVYLDGNKVGRYVAASAGFRGEANRRNTGLNWR